MVLEALKERKTIVEIAKEFSLHAQQITDWKRLAAAGLPEIFGKEAVIAAVPDLEAAMSPLYEKIGRLEVELDFLKRVQKKLSGA